MVTAKGGIFTKVVGLNRPFCNPATLRVESTHLRVDMGFNADQCKTRQSRQKRTATVRGLQIVWPEVVVVVVVVVVALKLDLRLRPKPTPICR